MKKFICLVISAVMFIMTGFVYAEDDISIKEYFNEVLEEEGKTDSGEYITRSEFIAVLMKSMNHTRDLYICSFYDIYDMDWNYVYIANAQRREITFGNADGGFLPNELLTVQDAITFVSRAYKINPVFGDSTRSVIGADYAQNYIRYALANKIYPNYENIPPDPDEYITIGQALQLIEHYRDGQDFGKEYIRFLAGYPKITETGNSTSIGLLLKVNKPCRVYYKIALTDKINSSYIPAREEVSEFLTSISAKDTEIRVNLPARQMESYNIFLTAVDDAGAISDVYSLNGVTPLPFTIGNGSVNNPYRIYTKYQLDHVRYYADKCFILCDDIDYNDNWEPIGLSLEQKDMFSGVFDGGGYSISGIKIRAGEHAGFFAVLNGGKVKNLNISADVRGESYVGVIAGESLGGMIENCHITGFSESDENIAGGIVGRNEGIIDSCVSALYTVTATAYSGGIAGSNAGDITNCISAVTSVYADMYSSSIAGINTGGLIKNCVGASIEAIDSLTKNSGRITTNREHGICENNYVYDGMISGDNIYRDKNGQDGEEISWSELTSSRFYEKAFSWDFRKHYKLTDSFILPCIYNVEQPKLQPGITVYAPLGISNEKELINIKNNLNAHYYLKNDIVISDDINWTPIGMTTDSSDYDAGFRGTFDGRGHTITGLKIGYDEKIIQYGLFGMLYGATVRNVSLRNVSIEGHSYVGTLAGVNYGTIDSCNASGKIRAYQYDRETLAGGICAMNYTNIYNSDSGTDITINATSATAGGIAAQNEGFIDGCAFDAKIEAFPTKKASNAFLGGICGINYSGMIYNCFGGRNIRTTAYTSYCGGIAGMISGGEIYKCSSYGTIVSTSENASSAYAGGIVGIASGGLVMNSYTQCNLSVQADKSYVGGISGFGENSAIQNVYSLNTIIQSDNNKLEEVQSYAGGITGYNDNGNISGTVAINPYIVTDGVFGEICSYSDGGYVDNNFYSESLHSVAAKHENAVQGKRVSLKELGSFDFYNKSVENGGLLGWSGNEDNDGGVWEKSSRYSYPYPVLYGVKKQNVFINPEEYRGLR